MGVFTLTAHSLIKTKACVKHYNFDLDLILQNKPTGKPFHCCDSVKIKLMLLDSVPSPYSLVLYLWNIHNQPLKLWCKQSISDRDLVDKESRSEQEPF